MNNLFPFTVEKRLKVYNLFSIVYSLLCLYSSTILIGRADTTNFLLNTLYILSGYLMFILFFVELNIIVKRLTKKRAYPPFFLPIPNNKKQESLNDKIVVYCFLLFALLLIPLFIYILLVLPFVMLAVYYIFLVLMLFSLLGLLLLLPIVAVYSCYQYLKKEDKEEITDFPSVNLESDNLADFTEKQNNTIKEQENIKPWEKQ